MDKHLLLGAWESERESIEQAALVGRGDVADLDAINKFSIYVARVVCKSEQIKSVDTNQPAGFVLVEPTRHADLKNDGRKVDSTFSTGAKQLVGRIHFVTDAVTRSVYESFVGDDDQVIFDRLEQLDLHESPSLIYLPRAAGSVLVFYPNGSGSDKGSCEISLNKIAISERDIVNAIQSVYKVELMTPDLGVPFVLWKKASVGQPIEEAERGVQKFVRIGLATKFHWCRVAMEQPDKDGRTDLEIFDETSGGTGDVVRHAILELKVLRSRGSTGNAYTSAAMDQHISEGVDQAHAYAERRNAIHRLLCCFDMRDTDVGDVAAFAHVKAKADGLGVKLHRWFLYRSSEGYRAAMAAASMAPAMAVAALSGAGAASVNGAP